MQLLLCHVFEKFVQDSLKLEIESIQLITINYMQFETN